MGILKVVPLLHLLDLPLGNLELRGNGLVVLSIANPGLLCVLEKLQPVLSLLLGVIPALLDPLDIALKELGLVRVFQDNLTLGNELINILNAGGSNVTGGGEHDAVKELNMGLQPGV